MRHPEKKPFQRALNPPARPPKTSWWTTVPRQAWPQIVQEQVERMRGSLGEWMMRNYPPCP